MKYPQATQADIALLLEGTYPFVSGGVSSWIHQVINAFPDYTFALVFIGGHQDQYGSMKYSFPEQVVHFEAHFVHSWEHKPPVRSVVGDPDFLQEVKSFHERMRAPHTCPHASMLPENLMRYLTRHAHSAQQQFLFSKEAWEYLIDSYEKHSSDPSFADYFWTVREMHKSIWALGHAAHNLIPVRAYHTISTGYAGFLGALLHYQTKRPLILSEHGIYTKERKIDLFQMNWLKDNRLSFEKGSEPLSYFQQMWIRFFEGLGKICYEVANPIVSLYETNRQRQIYDGADPTRTQIIPNGIDVERFRSLRVCRPSTPPPILCLIGRVVPIKDIKTYIRAMRTIINHIPEAEGWIAGPEDEDHEYVAECRGLSESLGLGHCVKFLGFQKVEDLFPRIGLLILSSISEGLPLVLLEGFAAGVPAVTTNVGACRQLIFGTGLPEDQAGSAGAVVDIADPGSMAKESIDLLKNQERWYAAQEAAIRRVESFYTQTQMIDRYRSIYSEALLSWQESDSNFVKS